MIFTVIGVIYVLTVTIIWHLPMNIDWVRGNSCFVFVHKLHFFIMLICCFISLCQVKNSNWSCYQLRGPGLIAFIFRSLNSNCRQLYTLSTVTESKVTVWSFDCQQFRFQYLNKSSRRGFSTRLCLVSACQVSVWSHENYEPNLGCDNLGLQWYFLMR